jgi:hypothetical protein
MPHPQVDTAPAMPEPDANVRAGGHPLRLALKTVQASVVSVIAPFVAVFVFAQVSIAGAQPDDVGYAVTVVVCALVASLVFVLCLGVPSFLLLHWQDEFTWRSSLLIGFAAGSLPAMIGLFALTVSRPAGWIGLYPVLSFGACGALSGIAFWLAWQVLEC